MSATNFKQNKKQINQQIRYSVPSLNQDYQAKFQKDSQYPHHKPLAVINALQILSVVFFILEVIQWINGYVYSKRSGIYSFIVTTCLYGITVIVGTLYTYLGVLKGAQQSYQMPKIKQIFNKLRTLGIRIKFYIRCYHKPYLICCDSTTQVNTFENQKIIPITECKDITGFFPQKIQEKFKKPFILISFKLEQQYRQPQQKQLFQIAYQYFIQTNKQDKYQQTKKIFEYQQTDQKFQDLVYKHKQSGCFPFTLIITFIASVLCISYPVNFIIDKIFIQRYKISIIKVIKLDRIHM